MDNLIHLNPKRRGKQNQKSKPTPKPPSDPAKSQLFTDVGEILLRIEFLCEAVDSVARDQRETRRVLRKLLRLMAAERGVK